jgi:hypothetical protein
MQPISIAARSAGPRRPIPHPLLSTTLKRLFACFGEYGWPDARLRFWVRTFNLLWVCAVRTPLHHLEGWRVRARVEARPLFAPPVFIIGHWRSGTTHLHQLLSQDPQFGVVTLMEAAFPLDFLTSIGQPLLAALIPPQRTMDAIPITIESPWEEEMAMACFGTLSFYYAFFFPRDARRIYREAVHFDGVALERVEAWWRDYGHFLKKVQCEKPNQRLLLKNPANSARVTALCERYPGAKFIHIHRHPEEVFASTLHLHRKLQEAWALQVPPELSELREMALANQADLMSACLAQTATLPATELVEVRMADLETDPLGALARIYEQLGLPGFATAAPHFRSYLEKLGTFSKNQLSLEPAEREVVRATLAHVYKRFGYI